ncbi:MAG: tetratricopeptide repeat protein [Armatimonadota bacterium]|jgi:tetratricopeptide (TPR) repeat protein
MIRGNTQRRIPGFGFAALLVVACAGPAVARVPAEGCYFEALRQLEVGKTKQALRWLRRAIVAPQVSMARGAYRHIAHRRELVQLLINEGVSGADPSFNIEKFHQALVARAHTRIAEILMQQGEFEEAARELERGKLADPDYPMAACRLAQAHLALGDPAAAIKEAKAAWLTSPLYTEYRRTYATAVARSAAKLYTHGETGKARLSFEFALQIDPLNPETLSDYGWLLFSGEEELPFRVSESAEKAIRKYTRSQALYMMQQATVLAPGVAGYHLQLGRAYQLLGERDKAIASHRRAAEAEPANPDARLAAARATLADGDSAAALEHLREARRRRPDDVAVHTELAAAYRRQGDATRATRSAEDALDLDASNARAHYELALSHLARGQESLAILQLERARALAPNKRVGLQARSRLAQLGAT